MPTLYDHRGDPIDLDSLKREQAALSLTGIRNPWHGADIARGLTPDRLARVLRAAADGDAYEYLVLAEEMEERDLHYASVLGTRKRGVSGIAPVVDTRDDSTKGLEIAEAVRELVEAPEFPGLVRDLLDGLGKGYSACEIMWDTSASQWSPREYLWRDPRYFIFDRESGQQLRLLDDDATFEGKPLPPYKFLAHIPHIKSGLPLRSGLARLSATCWMCKSFTMSDWMAFAEVFGMPLRVGRYGTGASEHDKDVLRMAVANLGSDAAAILPDSMRIEFQEAGKASGGHELFQRLAEYLDRQMSKAVLGQTMTTDDGSSQSQATVHDGVRLDIKNDDARQVAATVNRCLVRPFVDLNWGPQKHYPRVTLHEQESEDVQTLADALAKLVPLGNLGIEARIVRERLGFPDPADGAVLLGMPDVPDTTDVERAANRAQPDSLNVLNVDDELSQLRDEAMADWESMMSPVLDPVHELAAQCGSYEEFLAGLESLAGEMDASVLVRSLASATFKARALGDVTDGV